ncbi:MAG: CHAD domain-containing protein [Acidobacteria bacterium]|nr:CHAD domain-containing protein [Acidobacteriota bacterium]
MASAHPLRRPLEQQVSVFGRHAARALAGEADPLHDARVATRRLRELLPLCAGEAPGRAATRARRRARRIGRAFGGVREIDVALELVASMPDERLPAAGAGRLRHHLTDERARRRRRLRARVSGAELRKLPRAVSELVGSLDARPATGAWAQALAARTRRHAERVRAAVAEAGALYVSERVHEVRIAAKRLRYALEIAGAAADIETAAATARLKAVQDTLGRLHDREVLQDLIRAMPIPHGRPPEWAAQLDRLRADLAAECCRLHADFVAAQPALLELCGGAEEVAARLEPASGDDGSDERMLKMSLEAEAPREAVGGDPEPAG